MLLPLDPILHVGDRVRIECPETPELCVERAVGPDGTIDVPLLGPMPAAIRRGTDLAKKIAERLPGGLLPPQVRVRWIGGPEQEVSIEGAVARPLRLFAPRGLASERLLQAAKLLPEADSTLLPRMSRFPPGLALVVPIVAAERRINVLGAVAEPKTLPPAENLLLDSAIGQAGGLGAHGDPNAIVVLRHGESIPVQLPADAKYRLEPGDVVRVGLIAQRRFVLIQGLVARPGSVEYAPGMTATRALAASGGLLPPAKTGTLVWMTGAKTYRLSLAFLLQRRIPDPVIGGGDTLTVEASRP